MKRDEAEKLSRKLSESKAVHEKIYEQGISLRKDQNSISDISCLPTVLLSGMLTLVVFKITMLLLKVVLNCIMPWNGQECDKCKGITSGHYEREFPFQ